MTHYSSRLTKDLLVLSRTLDALWSIASKKKNRKFDATHIQILRLECTKFGFRWCRADPAGGACSTPPDP